MTSGLQPNAQQLKLQPQNRAVAICCKIFKPDLIEIMYMITGIYGTSRITAFFNAVHTLSIVQFKYTKMPHARAAIIN